MPIASVSGAASGGALPSATLLLALMEAGAPIPIPSDLFMLLVGERAGEGKFPLWAAVIAFELVAIAGTTALFYLCRGPARAMIARFGPRFGLTEERVDRARRLIARRSRAPMAIGRATPGMRTVTVVAAATADVSGRRALPAMIIGSSVFLQLHLLLGFVAGASIRDALAHAEGVVIVVLVAAAAIGAVVWLIRRRARGRGSVQQWAEACCPACLLLSVNIVGRGDQ